jgi:signal transduction histidine kinase
LARHNPDLPEKVRRDLESADRELARVSHIAQQTLGFYRDSSLPVRVVLPDLISDVLRIYERKLQYKNLTIEKRISPNLMVYALQGELKQIVSNLVSNAIDACDEGGRVQISARTFSHFHSGRQGIRISVADNGKGISNDEKQRLFTPFFTTKKDVGTGLGLWVTKDLLEQRGGRIRFRSSINHAKSGTVMNIFLPLEPSIPTADRILE